jgi:hypothetical protein
MQWQHFGKARSSRRSIPDFGRLREFHSLNRTGANPRLAIVRHGQAVVLCGWSV